MPRLVKLAAQYRLPATVARVEADHFIERGRYNPAALNVLRRMQKLVIKYVNAVPEASWT